MSLWKDFSKGLWKDIPPFRLVLGLCPTLAVTTAADNGLAMGLATTFVLTCSNTCHCCLGPGRAALSPKVGEENIAT